MWIFDPVLKETIWGGNRIARFKKGNGQDYCLPTSSGSINIGESWEISDLPGSESVVASGPDKGKTLRELLEAHGAAILGERNYMRFGSSFPLLIKFIDASQDLSVQVHPDAETARHLGYPKGKTEFWYAIDADKGSFIINGLKRKISKEECYRLSNSDALLDTLNFIDVHPGDAFYIPAGRIHALGAGTFVCEIQESSDVTFRLYDYHRKGPDGKERDLHIDEAALAISCEPIEESRIKYSPRKDVPVTLVASPFFTTNLLSLDQETIRDYSEWDTFVVLVATSGSALIKSQDNSVLLRQGHSVLIPASTRSITIIPDGEFSALETYMK